MFARRTTTALLTLALTLSALAAGPARNALAATLDPERYSTTPTGWGYYPSAQPGTIANYLSSHNMRLIDLEVSSTSPLKFSVSMVRNTGVYARGWWWYYGQTANSLAGKLSGKRILDLETYFVNGVKRYAAILVSNGQPNHHNWQWWLNQSPASIVTKINNFGGRIIDIDKVSAGKYNIVMVQNIGVDATGWWYYYQRTPQQIATLLNANSARLVDIERDGSGRFTVVMVQSGGEYWVWQHGLTAGRVQDSVAQYGMRIYDIERYPVNGSTRYAILMINNLDPVSTAARQAMWAAAGSAAFGFYLKQVDGAVQNALQKHKVFEPASMLKALYMAHAMRRVYLGLDNVNNSVTWYAHPNHPARYPNNFDYSDDRNRCAYASDGSKLTSVSYTDPLGDVVLRQMMEQSDNRTTDAVWDRYGKAAINARADWLGMTKTELNHRIGCTWKAPGVVKKSNELTLHDAGLLYEAIWRSNNPILGTSTVRDQFYDYMGTGLGSFGQVVDEEAASLGKDPSVAEAFKDALRGTYKPGGYLNWASDICDAQGCTKATIRSTGGGWIGVPRKVQVNGQTTIQLRGFVYGTFIDGVFDCGPGNSTDCSQEKDALSPARRVAFQEMLRPHIRSALMTW